MSKMDRMLNSKKDKQTIYEIYRACRLCGAGAGYKMPIIQNVVDLDDTDVELKQKIRECVQIEVHQDDKMPPLICELCVDKVNDFYEFLEMCRQTNKRTRLRLGLPPQSLPGGAPDAGDCILGLTEPVYVNDDADAEPLSKNKKPSKENKSNVKIKKEPQVKIESRSSRSRRQPTPPRTLRNSRNSREDSSLSRSQERSSRSSTKVSPRTAPKSILKKKEDTSLMSPRLKRTRDKEPVILDIPIKKVKIAVKAVSPPSKPKLREVKPAKRKPSPPPPPKVYKCAVCQSSNKTPQALTSHMRSHTAGFTYRRLACDPCREWFSSVDEATTHHRQHRSKSKPYCCKRCDSQYKTITAYDDHIANDQCTPWPVVPDVKCETCWHLFATNNLLDRHRCLGEDHRPGGKCSKCNRSYALLKNLKKHESTCTAKKKEVVIDPALLAKVKPIQVRVSRCDPLLLNVKQEHYDVSSVAADFGLDKNCVYPYISSFSGLRIKSELDALGGMVAINEEIKEEFCAEEYVHWDSDESDSDNDISLLPLTKEIDSLATLTLKTIFSRKCLGRVPRKRRRVKPEKMFDTLPNDTEDDVTRDINNIIDNLDDDDFNDLDGIDKTDLIETKDNTAVCANSDDQNESNVSKVSDDSKSSNDNDIDGAINSKNDTHNEECSKINSHDNEIEFKDKGNNKSDDKIDNDVEEKSKTEDDVDSSKNNKTESEGIIKNAEHLSDDISDGITISDESKLDENLSEESQNNNENSVSNSIDDDESKERKDIDKDDSLKTKDTSDDHQIDDVNNDRLNSDHQNDNIDVIEANKVNDDAKNDAQSENQIHDEITNDQNNDVSNDCETNLDDSMDCRTDAKASDDCKTKADASDDLKTNLETSDDVKTNLDEGADSISADAIDSGANVDDIDDSKTDGKLGDNDEHTTKLDAKTDSISDAIDNCSRDNDNANDDSLSKVDKNDEARENVSENGDSQVNDKVSEDCQITDTENVEKTLLSELDSQDSNSVTFNENLLNEELKNECMNEDKLKMAANEHLSQDSNLSASNDKKSDGIDKINGDSDVFDKNVDNKSKNSEDIDDSNLMAALDAQIGENSDVPEMETDKYGFNDKIALEDLITDKNTTKPMDLDSLPDEFNFDN